MRDAADSFCLQNANSPKALVKRRYQLDKGEAFYADITKQLNVEKVLEEALATSLEKEKYVSFGFFDMFLETPTPKFTEVFGSNKLSEACKDAPTQKLICEIHGKTHICKATGNLNLKTISKMRLIRDLGYNVTFATSEQLKPLAVEPAESKTSKVMDLLRQNLNKF